MLVRNPIVQVDRQRSTWRLPRRLTALDRRLPAGTRLLAYTGEGITRLAEVGRVARPAGAPTAHINGPPARFSYRETSDEIAGHGPEVVFRLRAKVAESEGTRIAWDWDEPPEQLTRCLSRVRVHFVVKRVGETESDSMSSSPERRA